MCSATTTSLGKIAYAFATMVAGAAFVTFGLMSVAMGDCEEASGGGMTVTCAGNEKTILLDSTFYDTDGETFSGGYDLVVFNASTIESWGTALSLNAPSVFYSGTSGSLSALGGDGLSIVSEGNVDASIKHNITGEYGVYIVTEPLPVARTIRILLGAGLIKASATGVKIAQQDEDFLSLTIASGATIDGWMGIAVHGGRTKVVLAGTIIAPDGGSTLSDGADELELHAGFVMEGQFDGSGGEDTLTFGGEVDEVFDLGRIGTDFLSFSSFSKTGASSWTLEGHASQAFNLDIAEGTVVFDGTLGEESIFTVGGGARLAGAGRLGTPEDPLERLGDIYVMGTLAPGSSQGRTLFAKDVFFDPTSTFEIETSASGTDRLDVRYAELAGTVHVIPSAGSLSSYEILVSELPLSGEFTAVTSSTPRYTPTLVHEADKVVLQLAQTSVTFSSYAKSPIQAAVASLLDAMGEDAPYYEQLDVMDPEAASQLLEQLSGSGFAATSGALLQNAGTLNTAVLGRIQQQSGAIAPSAVPLGYNTFSAGGRADGLSPSVWTKLVAGTSSMGGASAGSAALIGGVDVELGEEWTLGLLAGMGGASIVSGNATVQSVDLSAGFYGAKEFDALALRFGGSFTHHAASSSRRLVAPGVDETLTARYGALTAQVFAELAYDLELGPVDAELFGDLGYARHFAPGFTETGGAGALTVAGSSSDAVETTLGARFGRQYALGTVLMSVGGTLGWRHRFLATPSTTNSFSGGTPFQTAGVSTAGSAVVARADLRLDLSERSGLDLAYDIEWGSTGVAHAVSARYAMVF
jgi:uncharacterized protein with beta-barrel porin domain